MLGGAGLLPADQKRAVKLRRMTLQKETTALTQSLQEWDQLLEKILTNLLKEKSCER